jgi:phenylacetate-coenzyme A ligase PaaK-like adenylate-forming protein
MDTNYSILLAKIKEKLHDLELVLDIDRNNTELKQKINLIKNNIDKAQLTKDMKILDSVWDDNFKNKDIQNDDDLDFM